MAVWPIPEMGPKKFCGKSSVVCTKKHPKVYKLDMGFPLCVSLNISWPEVKIDQNLFFVDSGHWPRLAAHKITQKIVQTIKLAWAGQEMQNYQMDTKFGQKMTKFFRNK